MWLQLGHLSYRICYVTHSWLYYARLSILNKLSILSIQFGTYGLCTKHSECIQALPSIDIISDLINYIKPFQPYEWNLKPVIKHLSIHLSLMGSVDILHLLYILKQTHYSSRVYIRSFWSLQSITCTCYTRKEILSVIKLIKDLL